MKATALACALGIAFTVARIALAQTAADVAAARDLFMEGTRLGHQGQWEQARERFARSLALKRSPTTLYSLAVAQTKSGKLVEALESFRAFVREPGAAAQYQQAAARAAEELERRVARVVIRLKPAGVADVSVLLDQEAVPPAALETPRLANPGEHVLRATSPRHRPAELRFTVAEGETATVTLTLAPLPAAVAATPAPPPEEEAPFPILPVALMAGGGTLMGVGLVVGIAGLSQASGADASDDEDADAARTKGIVADVLLVTGALAAGAGVVLFFVGGNSDAKATVGVAPAHGGALGLATLRF